MMSKIGKVIDGLDAPALRRILDAPLEAWRFLRYAPFEGDPFCARCFVGHILDLRDTVDTQTRYAYAPALWCNDSAERRALRAAENRILRALWKYRVRGAFNAPRLIRAIKIRALKALERHVLESAVPEREHSEVTG